MPDKITRLAKDLEPFLVKLIHQGVSGGGGGQVAMATHPLASDWHSGALSDAQGPQFLKLDGSRMLVGNLPVAAGYTVDGVDISAHAANPDAHHARVTAGDGMVIVGQQVSLGLSPVSGLEFATGRLQIADTLAGGGLVMSGKALAVGAGADIDVSADAVAVISSGDVGTTPQAKVLKSTETGGLTLGSLGVKGSVDITNGGNLYVAGSIGGASGVLVTLGNRVGFGRIPDPQFMVDVNGPLRADILVGKHAIQLEGVLLLAHYDGAEPYASNFTGELNGHMGQTALTSGAVPVRPGRFYKGLAMAGATTNYCPNPSFETNTTGWNNANGGTWSRVTTDAAVGTACLKGVVAGSNQAMYMDIAQPAGSTFVVSVYVKRETPTGTAGFYVCDSSGGNAVVSANVAEADGWKRVSVTYIVQADGVVRLVLRGAAGTHYYDGVQVEYAPLSPYCDGAMGTGHGWTGTAHASTSYRLQGALSYGTAGNIKAERGTVMAWVWVDGASAGGFNGVLEAGSAWGRLSLYLNNGVTPILYAGNASGTNNASGPSIGSVGVWAHVACTWDIYDDRLVVYTNGAAGTPSALANTPDLGTRIYVGDNPAWAGEVHLNGVIDDLVILDRVATAQEIRAVYESAAPVFAESSVFSFRATPTGLVWADENGLWMRDAAGGAVLGVYGGEAASLSWGGKTLAKGDILFGQVGAADGGWLYFDRDGVSSKPYLSLGYADKTILSLDSVGARVDGVISVSAGGEFRAGGTTIKSSGIKLNVNASENKFSLVENNGVEVGYLSGFHDLVSYVDLCAGRSGKIGVLNLLADRSDGSFVVLSVDAPNDEVFSSNMRIVGTSAINRALTVQSEQFAVIGIKNSGTEYAILGVPAASNEGFTGTAFGDAVLRANRVLHMGTYNAHALRLLTNNTVRIAIDSAGLAQLTGDVLIGATGGTQYGMLFVRQDSATGAKPPLQLAQQDLSEEFIRFNTTVSAGNPVNTTALGSYYGRVRVSVNGTFYWMALYN